MVVGEPGIGKTALCEQLISYVVARDGRPLIGHCYEAGSRSLPYLAFVEALRRYVAQRDTAALHAEFGAAAGDIGANVGTCGNAVRALSGRSERGGVTSLC